VWPTKNFIIFDGWKVGKWKSGKLKSWKVGKLESGPEVSGI